MVPKGTAKNVSVSVREAVAKDVMQLAAYSHFFGNWNSAFPKITTFSTKTWTDQFEPEADDSAKGFLRDLLRNYFFYGVRNPSVIFVESAVKSWPKMLDILPDNVVLMPIMIKGYELGRLVGYALTTRRKTFDLVLFGIHKAAVKSRDGKVLFPTHTLYADKADTELVNNSRKALLVVDDTCEFFSFSKEIATRFSDSGKRDIFFLFGMRLPEAANSNGAEYFEEVAYDLNSGMVLYKWSANAKKVKRQITRVDKGIAEPMPNFRSNKELALRPGPWNLFAAINRFRGKITGLNTMRKTLGVNEPYDHVGFRVNEFIIVEAAGKPFDKRVTFKGLTFNVPVKLQGMHDTAIVLNANTTFIDEHTGVVRGGIVKIIDWPAETGWYKTNKETGIPCSKKAVWEEPDALYLRRAMTEPYIGSLVYARGGIGVLGSRRRGIDANYAPDVGFGVATNL